MVWDGTDPTHGSLNDIAKHVKINLGDTIITSSFSAIFPEGIMIGTVDKVDPNSGDNFQEIEVKLSTSFANLTYVYIVSNLFKEEQRKLEESQPNDH